MTRKIHLSQGNSPFIGRLSKGCRECMKGAKLVLFVTGRCAKSCFYCPISEERRGKSVVFANEVKVEDIQEALTEARMINATGMGITGGEPLLEVDLTRQFIQIFKNEFGTDFHIHLYTGLEPVPLEAVKNLLDAGLDELRLHRFQVGEDYLGLQRMMQGRGKLGLEIPAIPGMFNQLKTLLRQFDEVGIDFVNINELEFAALNTNELQRRGLQLDPDTIASVKGSEAEALKLVEWAAKATTLKVHFCPLSLKDGTQLRNRFRRRAKNVAKPFERISKEGLLVKGIIRPPTEIPLQRAQDILLTQYHVSITALWINENKNRLETSTRIVRRLAKKLKVQGFDVGITEEYPIKSRFQVSYTPL